MLNIYKQVCQYQFFIYIRKEEMQSHFHNQNNGGAYAKRQMANN